ncbi:MAG: M50 family metallopeptidase [Proteobacteria bacterium]|nr:M50 family metallopeptidase [Pseudomonadota bacterium]
MFLITTLLSLDIYIIDREVCALFAIGFIFTASIFSTSGFSRLRVLIHELRHALVVIMSGNVLKKIVVKKTEGEVSYEMYQEKTTSGPLITLAPYCFPIFSLPVMIFAIVFEGDYRAIFSLILGGTLGIDIFTAYREIHPGQTDFKQIVGGFFASALFISGVAFFWINFCLLWVVGGRNAYLYSAGIAYDIGHKIIEEVREE